MIKQTPFSSRLSKLDNIVETPDYIKDIKPAGNKSFPLWKLFVPAAAVLAIAIVIPITIRMTATNKGSMVSDKSGYDVPEGNKEGGQNSSEPQSTGDSSSLLIDANFSTVLNSSGLNEGIYILAYKYHKNSYSELVYTFDISTSKQIINSVNNINSDLVKYNNKSSLDNVVANSQGDPMGINYKLIFTDGEHTLNTYYHSQFKTITAINSAYDISGSEAYNILNERINMEYDSQYDQSKK